MERGLQRSQGREDPAPHSLRSAPGCLWLTGAGKEVMTGSEFLTLVVVGSDDLGLLRMLLLCQVSYLRTTEGPAVTTGTTVEFTPGQSTELCMSAKKAAWEGRDQFIPGLAGTCAHPLAQPCGMNTQKSHSHPRTQGQRMGSPVHVPSHCPAGANTNSFLYFHF